MKIYGNHPVYKLLFMFEDSRLLSLNKKVIVQSINTLCNPLDKPHIEFQFEANLEATGILKNEQLIMHSNPAYNMGVDKPTGRE